MVLQAKVHEAEMQQAHSTRVSLEARHQAHLEATPAKSQSQLASLHAVYQASLAMSEANGQAKLHCMQALHQQEVTKIQHQLPSLLWLKLSECKGNPWSRHWFILW
jgi:hypothetical protein